MDFQVDEMVVVPGCGVGRVDAVEEMNLGDTSVETYRIDLGEELGKYWVPKVRADAEGVRRPMSADRVEDTWELIRSQTSPDKLPNWRNRRRRYEEMMLSNEPGELATLVGELVCERNRKREKKQVLSHHELRIFERTQTLIVQEIAAATGRTREVVRERLEEVMAEASQG